MNKCSPERFDCKVCDIKWHDHEEFLRHMSSHNGDRRVQLRFSNSRTKMIRQFLVWN